MFHYLFGFSGRINRAKIWLFVLIQVVYAVAAIAVVLTTMGLDNIMAVAQHKAPMTVITDNPALRPEFSLIGLINLVLFIAGLAVTTKRLHDRDKSAWWLLVFVFLPLVIQVVRLGMMFAALHAQGPRGMMMSPASTLIGGVAFLILLWGFVELYCFRGTEGENRYGPDPLA